MQNGAAHDQAHLVDEQQQAPEGCTCSLRSYHSICMTTVTDDTVKTATAQPQLVCDHLIEKHK